MEETIVYIVRGGGVGCGGLFGWSRRGGGEGGLGDWNNGGVLALWVEEGAVFFCFHFLGGEEIEEMVKGGVGEMRDFMF